jgi:argininosuccinate lyase
MVAAAMSSAEFDAASLEARAGGGWTTLTELADTLVRDHGLPFRAAHAVTARLIAARQERPAVPLSDLLTAVSNEVLGVPISYSESALEQILSARHFVNVRRTHGGPAPEETRRAAVESARCLDADEQWWKDAAAALKAAEHRLEERSAAL